VLVLSPPKAAQDAARPLPAASVTTDANAGEDESFPF